MDVKASNSDAGTHTSEDGHALHAGGIVVAGKGACVPTDALGRQPGEALCPERYDEEKLEQLRKKLGSYSFASLYQQHPVPAEGGLFKREWFKNIISNRPEGLRWCRGYDLALSTSATSDYTASFKVAFDKQGNMYVDGGFRRRIEYPEQRKYILGRIREERDTEHGIELSANGRAVIQDIRRERDVLGRAFRGVEPEGTKVSRAVGWVAIAEEGKLFLVRGPWNHEFIDEACSFPQGTHDDQIDAVSIAVRMCRSRGNRSYGF
jgi:predicted phage terminase large subunit-like protein